MNWLDHASRFTFHQSPEGTLRSCGDIPIAIEKVTQRDGSFLWSVRQSGSCLNTDGEWEYEPQPSSRDDEFFARCRFATKEEAFMLMERFARVTA